MSENEKWYDEHVAPVLLDLCKKCDDRNMPFLAQVEYDPGELALTSLVRDTASLSMAMLWLCAKSGNNVDAFIINVIRHCRKHEIDMSSSFVLQRFGNYQPEASLPSPPAPEVKS